MKQILSNFFATLRRYKVSSTLNILGLSVAFASLYFIGVQLQYDLAYNRSVSDYRQIYRIETPDTWEDGNNYDYTMPRPQCDAIGEMLPDVISYAAINPTYNGGNVGILKNGVNVKIEEQLHSSTNGVVNLLDMNILDGRAEDFVIPNSNNVLVSEHLSQKYDIAVGDTVVSGDSESDCITYNVVAIYENMPSRSSFSSMNFIMNYGDRGSNDPNMYFTTYYYKLHKEVDIEVATQVAGEIFVDVMRSKADPGQVVDDSYSVRFNPIKDIYLAEDISDHTGGNRTTIYILIAIAVVITLIAFVNFINFFFALVPFRIRAVNARKIFGCSRRELIANFIFEAVGLFAVAFALTIFIVAAMQDGFMGEYISGSVLLLDNVDVVVALALFGALASVVIAAYPAFYITSFPTAMVVKGGFGSSKVGQLLRHSLIGVQFISSMVLFICAILMQSQYHYMLNYDIGIDTDNVVMSIIPSEISQDQTLRDDFLEKIKACDDILDGTFISGDIPSTGGSRSRRVRDDGVVLESYFYTVMPNTLQFLGIEMLSGDGFITDDKVNSSVAFVVNEMAEAKYRDNENYLELGSRGFTFQGVCSNFNYRSLKEVSEPMVFSLDLNSSYLKPRVLYFRTTQDAESAEVERHIKDVIKELVPDCYTEYISFKSQEEIIAKLYGDEHKQSRIMLIFTLVSIIISLMGVFGLVLFETQFRQQEIVIRRVHGATVREILLMINRKFMLIIAICFVVAAPVSYLVVSRWLSAFAYHIPISAWVFVAVLAVVTIVVTSIVTVQSLKAANSNPAELIGKNA